LRVGTDGLRGVGGVANISNHMLLASKQKGQFLTVC
jgi:hypothetical protein